MANAFGYYTMNITQTPGYRNDTMAGEDMPLVNLGALYNGGDALSFQTSSFPGFAKVPVSDAATLATNVGTSTFTTLAADMTSATYSGCPATITNAAARIPDPAILNEAGVGGLVSYCLTVGSSAGMSADTRFSIGGPHGNFEISKVASVADGTHITANMSMYHHTDETISFGGLQGWGFNLPGDDHAAGAYNFDDAGPNNTILHKYFYALGNDASNLYVYLNSAATAELTSTQYWSLTPNAVGSLGASTLSGTGLASISITSAGDYAANAPNNVSTGQQLLGAPGITVDPSGSACSVKPTAHSVTGVSGNVYKILSIVIDSPGVCSTPPTSALVNVWHTPYRLAPTTVTVKVTDPVTGSSSSGYLLTQVIDPSRWTSGTAVEIPGWPHDFTGGNETFSQYQTGGNSQRFGPKTFRVFKGDMGFPDGLEGIVNATNGYNYFADAAHPIGPGVAYEKPPVAREVIGDFSIIHQVSVPPTDALADVGCGTGLGVVLVHPCAWGIPTAYDLFHPHMNNGGVYFDKHFRFDPTQLDANGNRRLILSWDGELNVPTINSVAITAAGDGTKVLANNGQYINPPSGGSSSSPGTYYTAGGGTQGGPTVGTLNHVICGGIVIPPGGLSVGHIAFSVSTGDGGSATDVGIYTGTGTLAAHTGCQSFSYGAAYTVAFAGGTQTIPAGKAYVCYTSTNTSFNLNVANQAPTFYQIADVGAVGSSGTLSSSIIVPADNPSASAYNTSFPPIVLYP